MAVIKGSTPDTLLKQAVVLDLGDITRQASKLRVAAENKASEILDTAEQQARKLISEAAEQGHAQGHAQGLQQGLAEGQERGHAEALAQNSEQLQGLVAAWSDCLQRIDGHRDDVEQQIKQSALEFAIVFAEKLTHRVIEVDPTVVVDQLAQSLQYILRPLDVTVKVHPDDRALVEQAVPELLAEFEQVQHIKLVEDAALDRGGIITQYGKGQVDATIETQLDRLVEMMLPLDEQAKQAVEQQARADVASRRGAAGAAAATPQAEELTEQASQAGVDSTEASSIEMDEPAAPSDSETQAEADTDADTTPDIKSDTTPPAADQPPQEDTSDDDAR